MVWIITPQSAASGSNWARNIRRNQVLLPRMELRMLNGGRQAGSGKPTRGSGSNYPSRARVALTASAFALVSNARIPPS